MGMMLRMLLAVVVAGGAALGTARAEEIRVSAAISLKDALLEAGKAYEKQSGDTLAFSFGASGQLLTQIKNGAPVDLFLSAAARQVDELEVLKLTENGTRIDVARNSLVLIVPAGAKEFPVSFEKLADALGKVAIGEPKSVPAGDYATQVLHSLHLTDTLKDRLVYGTNVRQVLAYVENGDVAAGIVYATDARESGDKVKVAAIADARWHKPIVYPGVVLAASTHKDKAKAFLAYLTGPDGKKVLASKGFLTTEAPDAGKKP